MRFHFAVAATAAVAPTLLLPVRADAAPTCFGEPATIVASGGLVRGTDGPDVIVITGTRAAEVHAYQGRDRICGATIAYGGAQSDLIRYRNDSTTPREVELGGGPGTDSITVVGATYGDVLGGPGADTLRLGPGAHTIAGGRGDDVMHGGRGADTIIGGDGRDAADGGRGTDSCSAEHEDNCEA